MPRKRFKYIPLGPRIRRYYNSAPISKLLQSHTDIASDSNIHDIQQTCAWKRWFSRKGIFGGDPRALALSLCLDGTNPFSKEKNTYSMWPMTVALLNLPSRLRRLPGFLQLIGIIPGRSEPKNIDPYLDIFVDEILSLQGSVIFDAHRNSNFNLKLSVVLNVLDYPGQSKIFHCHGECNNKTLYII